VNYGANIFNAPNGTNWPYLAEIFYEPPEGGYEQFSTAEWGGGYNDPTTTTMVPDDGSVKACGGDPGGSTDPFDEDPQGTQNVEQDPDADGEPYPYTAGACTLWH
jgi:hypothetical protein